MLQVRTNSQHKQHQKLVMQRSLEAKCKNGASLEICNNSNSGGGTPAFPLVHNRPFEATVEVQYFHNSHLLEQ